MSALRLTITLDEAALDALTDAIEARISRRHARVPFVVLPKIGYDASDIDALPPELRDPLRQVLGEQAKRDRVEVPDEPTGGAVNDEDR